MEIRPEKTACIKLFGAACGVGCIISYPTPVFAKYFPLFEGGVPWRKNAGYVIRESVLFDNKRGFAIAEHGNPKVPAPFVTWQFAEENGRRDYYWGHYHADEASAQKDFKDRAADYKRMYKVQEVKPRTIAQQMKEAAKLAEADRGRAAPKKTTPDRGDR